MYVCSGVREDVLTINEIRAFHKERETAQTWTGIVNSYSRASLGNSTPYDEFVKEYGYEGRKFLERLGIARIPANEVRSIRISSARSSSGMPKNELKRTPIDTNGSRFGRGMFSFSDGTTNLFLNPRHQEINCLRHL